MVIDDDGFVLKLLSRVLADIGYTNVICFDHAKTALKAIETGVNVPDVILLDLNMPMMDGVEVIHMLGECKFANDLIFMTSADQQTVVAAEKIARAHKLSVLGVQPKPISRDSLLRVLSQRPRSPTSTPSCAHGAYTAAEVAHAISNGELINYYQPKVHVGSGEVIGVEALVRWNHPTDGLVFPDDFIPISEASGSICGLTRRVIEEALGQLNRWNRSGFHPSIAVNITMDDLARADFVEFMDEQAKAAGVSPSKVTLELTETQIASDPIAVLTAVARLRLHQFELAIDDFGTGHSSLAQLRDLSFNELKIDRSFTSNAFQNRRLKAIFQASVDLAKVLGLEPVAEGVETADDLKFVRESGCWVAQGYFFAKPMPEAEIPTWLEDWKSKVTREPSLRCSTDPRNLLETPT